MISEMKSEGMDWSLECISVLIETELYFFSIETTFFILNNRQPSLNNFVFVL